MLAILLAKGRERRDSSQPNKTELSSAYALPLAVSRDEIELWLLYLVPTPQKKQTNKKKLDYAVSVILDDLLCSPGQF